MSSFLIDFPLPQPRQLCLGKDLHCKEGLFRLSLPETSCMQDAPSLLERGVFFAAANPFVEAKVGLYLREPEANVTWSLTLP